MGSQEQIPNKNNINTNTHNELRDRNVVFKEIMFKVELQNLIKTKKPKIT